MLSNLVKTSFLVVLAASSVSNAYLVAGSGGGIQAGIGWQPGQGGGFGGQDCNPYDPSCAQQGGGQIDCNPYDPSCAGQGNDQAQTEYKSIQIGRTVTNERLDLRALSGIGPEYSGWEVVSVTANTQPNNPYTTIAQLLADNQVVASQTDPGSAINLTPSYSLVIGSVNDLELWISGSTYIDSIQIQVVNRNGGGQRPPPYPLPYPTPQPQPYPQPYPQPQPQPTQQRVNLYINRAVYNNDSVDLTQYIDFNRYRGWRIQQVLVTAAPMNNVALADLLVNGFDVGTLQFSRGSSTQSLWLQNQPDIGGAAGSLVLSTRGNATIQSVTLVLSY